jgi:hypothetical protein
MRCCSRRCLVLVIPAVAVARSVADRMTAWALAENLGMILVDVIHYKTDGSVLERGRGCYTLWRDGESWKIVTVAEVQPPFLGPGDVAG